MLFAQLSDSDVELGIAVSLELLGRAGRQVRTLPPEPWEPVGKAVPAMREQLQAFLLELTPPYFPGKPRVRQKGQRRVIWNCSPSWRRGDLGAILS